MNSDLKETISSVLKQETNYNIEVVVVDNNDDFEDMETLALIKAFRDKNIRYYKNKKNLGMFGNWNRCIQLASADWILILHDDDTISSHYVENMMNSLALKDDISCIGCKHLRIDENGNSIKEKNDSIRSIYNHIRAKSINVGIKDFYYNHLINIMGLLINKECAIKIGGFNNIWDPISDYIFILNMLDVGNIVVLNEKLINYRIAVNASGTPKHILGMIEVDAFMREDLNKSKHFLPHKLDYIYRNLCAVTLEKQLYNEWTKNLSILDKECIKNEISIFNEYMQFKSYPDMLIHIFMLWSKFYKVFVDLIRK